MAEIELISEALKKWDIYPEDISEIENEIHVTLVGDWKHTHTASDTVLREIGFTFKCAMVIPENPDEISDWYKAIRIYTR